MKETSAANGHTNDQVGNKDRLKVGQDEMGKFFAVLVNLADGVVDVGGFMNSRVGIGLHTGVPDGCRRRQVRFSGTFSSHELTSC